MNDIYNVTINGVNVSYGDNNNDGVVIVNSSHNLIINNFGYRNNIGLDLVGNSRNNSIYNNQFGNDNLAGYVCDAPDSQMNSEYGGANIGNTKKNCYWLAAVPSTAGPLGCPVALAPSLYVLTNDYVYRQGNVCFSVFANQTTIDCRGHTILATNGGTFALFGAGSQTTSELENCYLKGFTTPIVIQNNGCSWIGTSKSTCH